MGRVLVTGGAGFLGSHICERLLAEGHEVIAMDNLASGRTENLDDFFHLDRFSFYDHDVTEYIHVAGELDWVMHIGSLISPILYQNYPIKNLKLGALGSHRTLGLAKEKDACYLFTSTSEVYGDPEVNHQPESYHGNIDYYGPRTCYDESKRYGEAIVRAHLDEHYLDVRGARIFNTYRPRMRVDDGRVIPTLVNQALSGEPLTLHGDADQTRNLCYVSDVIRVSIDLQLKTLDVPVNLGNPEELSILKLAEIIIDLTDSSSEISNEDRPPQDTQVRRPDITRARGEPDWEPKIFLEAEPEIKNEN